MSVRKPAARAVLAVAATLAAAAVTGAPAARATGAERLPAVCVAHIYNGAGSLNVGVLTPEYPPYWDVTPPVGAWAYASGFATFTPNGRFDVTCTQSPGLQSDGETVWPAGTFTGTSTCSTARGGVGDGMGTGAKLYEGQANVTIVDDSHVSITCHGLNTGIGGSYSYS